MEIGERIGDRSHITTGKKEIVPSSDMDDSETESELVVEVDLDVENSNELDDESEPSTPVDENAIDNYSLINDMDSSDDDSGEEIDEHHEPTSGGSEIESEGENNDNDALAIDVDNLMYDCRTGDEMFDILTRDPEWTESNYADIHVRQFNGPTGFNLPGDFDVEKATPIDYFQLFFSDQVLQTICDNTNKYQQFRVAQKQVVNPEYKENHWEETTLNEMRAFFGLAIMFGLMNQPRYRTFWSKDPFLGNIAVQRVFSLKRYSKLSEYLHVSDRETEKPKGHPHYDKLGKIRWLIDHMVKKFPEYKFPEKNQTVDEQIMKFSGRVNFLQYNVYIFLYIFNLILIYIK